MFLLLFVSLLFSQTVFHFSLCYEHGSLFDSGRIRQREEHLYRHTVSDNMVRNERKNTDKKDGKQGIEWMEGTTYIVSDGRIRTESGIGWLLSFEQKRGRSQQMAQCQ